MGAYGNPFYSPEMFFSSGAPDGATDNTAGWAVMCNFARSNGGIDIRLTPGATYLNQNPYALSGVPYCTIEGEGANLMNPRGTSAPINTFLANYSVLQTGSGPFTPNGFNIYSGGNVYGSKINTALAGATSIVMADGSNCPLGRILIYGSDRQGNNSAPPCCNNFEYNVVNSAVGPTGTLASPTRNFYDSQWPETWDAGTAPLAATFTGSISGTTLTVTAVASGTLAVGNTIDSATVFSFLKILSQLSGSAGSTGTYQLSGSASVGSGTLYAITGNVYGAARVISLEASTVFPGGQNKFMLLRNLNLIDNVNFTAANAGLVNGSISIQGVDEIYTDNCRCSAAGITQCRESYNTDLFIGSALSSNPWMEIDKMVELAFMKRGSSSSVTAGLGCYDLILEDINLHGVTAAGLTPNTAIQPIRNFQVNRGTLHANTGNCLIGLFPGNKGPRKIRIDSARFLVEASSVIRVMNSANLSLTVDVSATSPTLVFSRANYYTSAISNSMFVGAVFRNSTGLPVFRVTRMPYCAGDPVTGNVSMDGDFYGAISIGDTINLPTVHDIEVKSMALDGPSAGNITSLFGNAPGFTTSPFVSPKIRDKFITDSSIQITSEMCYLNQASNFYVMYLGQPFKPAMVVIDVAKAGTSGTLALSFISPAGASNVLFTSVDLTTTGRRVIDRAGVTAALGADNITGGLQTANMQEITFQDTSASLAKPGPAQWSVTFYGTWLGLFGGTN